MYQPPSCRLGILIIPAVLVVLLAPVSARAADIDGAALAPAWGLPFAAMLLSIALMPLLAPAFWHAHFGKLAAGWAIAFVVPFAAVYGAAYAVHLIVHALLAEYLPFIALLAALYTVAGGICLHGRLRGSPGLNVGLLALGGALASVTGTTGAAMLLIRPLLRANEGRPHVAHVVVFFIFIVANAGGSLTPLGDPPLFLGFLKGVGFFWTGRHLLLPMLLVCAGLLLLFFLIDGHVFRRDATRGSDVGNRPRHESPGRESPGHESPGHESPGHESPGHESPASKLHLDGKINFLLLGCVIALVLMSGVWRPGIVFDVLGTPLPLQDALRDALLFVVLLVSLRVTPVSARRGNQFDWAPIIEVAKLFAGIFVTIAPVILILGAGSRGAFAPLLALVSDAQGRPIDAAYFWATGLLSGFLDNAPTYLVFFNTAGGDAASLMTTGARTLGAISAGAVFMGALTYIGNAPNFMVKAIAEERGVAMPGFFGYMAWSVPILLPLFGLVTWLFF
ncbi:sodium:proton antiporter [Robbsia sp. Bb-Pol-6]|uniref:Sodium:proton antiporter n=1 Tax=Robbsia betulipollinis TaxID=2981849 RepID=A0ABT3ZPT6_9BURK|nr:sodium:proton antiporter [Robbsia betulipollinis]MCY0388576.1 sodium:proton antiporter [Robbsia betulipollinis]